MFKKTLTLLMAVAMLSACSSDEPAKELDIRTFSTTALATVETEDSLVELSKDVAPDFYELDFDGIADYSIIISGTSATATEIAVFKLESDDAMTSAKEAVDARLEDLMASYKDYRPNEVEFIENALILEEGNYLLLSVVTDNEAIETLFLESFK